jgi:hypothetical protein
MGFIQAQQLCLDWFFVSGAGFAPRLHAILLPGVHPLIPLWRGEPEYPAIESIVDYDSVLTTFTCAFHRRIFALYDGSAISRKMLSGRCHHRHPQMIGKGARRRRPYRDCHGLSCDNRVFSHRSHGVFSP